MRCVVDSSVAVKWVLDEVHSDKARRLRDSYRAQQVELIAPDWFVLEIMNILGKAAARKSITPPEHFVHKRWFKRTRQSLSLL